MLLVVGLQSFIVFSFTSVSLLCLSVCPSICFVCLSIHLFCLSVCLLVPSSVCLSSVCSSICLSVQYIYLKHESSNIQYVTKSQTIQNHLETKEVNY